MPKPRSAIISLSPRFSEFSFLHLTAVSMLNAVGLDGFARQPGAVGRLCGGRAA